MPRIDGQLLARWQARLRDVDCTPLEFFDRVRDAVIESGLTDFRFSEVMRREKGVFSAGRIYFRIRFGRLFFDVSAFIAGRFLVVAYWLHQDWPGIADLFSEIPGVRSVIEHAVEPATYYRVDEVENLQRVIHDAIVEVVDQLSGTNGLEILPDDERQPIWEEMW